MKNYLRDNMKLTEVSASDKLEEFRASKEVIVTNMGIWIFF